MAVNQDSATLPKTPFSRTAVAVTAETAFHAPTAMVDLLLIADNTDGARITGLYAIARAAIATACNCQLYKRVGSTYTLIDSALLAVATPSASVANHKAVFNITLYEPLELEPDEGLAVAIGQSIANGVAFRCQGGFYAA